MFLRRAGIKLEGGGKSYAKLIIEERIGFVRKNPYENPGLFLLLMKELI